MVSIYVMRNTTEYFQIQKKALLLSLIKSFQSRTLLLVKLQT